MKTYFLDTNILVDFVTNRPPFGVLALEIFKKKFQGEWIIWTSDFSILSTYYLISKVTDNKTAKEKIAGLLKHLEISTVPKTQLLSALSSSFKDFEDAAQYYSALQIVGLEGIITRNAKDYKNSLVPIFSPEQLVY